MVELRERADGSMERSWGGDTLNTAVYLARLGMRVDYVTALGDDGWSDEMVAAWQAEGIGTGLVFRLPGRLPGLYVIQTDAGGERRFLYWRESAAARRLFERLEPAGLAGFEILYLSGITLSIFDADAREALLEGLATARTRGALVVFDTNFRVRGWPDRGVARALYERVFGMADIVLASVEDLSLLYEGDGVPALLRHAAGAEVVLKLLEPASVVRRGGAEWRVRAAPARAVVDTTAAGDSFAAAYLAARLRGAAPEEAARAGHALAGLVVGYSGAIVPRAAMLEGSVA